MNHSPTLVEELAGRRAIIVIGAGVSAECASLNDPAVKMPTWKDLLARLSSAISFSREDQEEFDSLLNKEKFLDAAEIIESKMAPMDLVRTLSRTFLEPAFSPSKWHSLIAEFDLKTYITTNYDNLFEVAIEKANSSAGFKYHSINEKGLIGSLRSSYRLLLKAHGSLSSPETRIILSKTGYYQARKDFRDFYEILDALFLVNTIFFVGCGLSDPDFLLLMENSNIRVSHDCRHYALVPSGRHSAIREALRTAYNLELIEYAVDASGSHDEGYAYLNSLLGEVQAYRSIPR